MINFDEIISDFSKLKQINLIVIWQVANVVILEYFNPFILTLSASGSALYIWLKIKREFFDKKEEK